MDLDWFTVVDDEVGCWLLPGSCVACSLDDASSSVSYSNVCKYENRTRDAGLLLGFLRYITSLVLFSIFLTEGNGEWIMHRVFAWISIFLCRLLYTWKSVRIWRAVRQVSILLGLHPLGLLSFLFFFLLIALSKSYLEGLTLCSSWFSFGSPLMCRRTGGKVHLVQFGETL